MKKSIRLFATVMVCMAMALCVSCKKDNPEPSGGGNGGGNTGGGGGNAGGEISGCFSVSPTTTVEFAQGNLYWDGSAFRFEENQWSFSDTWNENHVSHFKWSDAANAVTGDYSYSGDLFCANNFTVAGDSHTWRTLSKAEWDYLLGTASPSRANASSLRAWKELGSGIKGLVILPDGTDASVMSSISSTEALATHGAVFLPVAGCRYGTDVGYVGSYGIYWSSTPAGTTRTSRTTCTSIRASCSRRRQSELRLRRSLGSLVACLQAYPSRAAATRRAEGGKHRAPALAERAAKPASGASHRQTHGRQRQYRRKAVFSEKITDNTNRKTTVRWHN